MVTLYLSDMVVKVNLQHAAGLGGNDESSPAAVVKGGSENLCWRADFYDKVLSIHNFKR